MPEIVPPGLIRVQALWQVSGTPDIAVGTFHFRQTPDVETTDAQIKALANAVSTFYGALSSYTVAMTLQRISAFASTHSSGSGGDWERSFVYPDITRSLAGGAGSSLPPQVAVVLSLVTGQPGRSGRGRLYLGPVVNGISSDAGSGAQVSTAAITGINTAATTLRTTASGQGTPWVVYSRTRQAMFPVLATKIGNRFDTQRRRRSAFKESYVST